ncbi:MAG: DUF3108 domain-containing protein [Proteobacteria bacterium]|nr:DUF3108 domain-containing protein [Pseudomonadota bacterium]
MRGMNRMIRLVGVLLASMAGLLLALPAVAMDLNTREELFYGVYWGPLSVGHARLTYTPTEKRGYRLDSEVWDESSLLELNDRWSAVGRHISGTEFLPMRYEAIQRENDYRADKLVVFDSKAKQIRYTNRLDKNDTAPVLAWNRKMRDSLSAVYAWRRQGVEGLQRGEVLEVMGVKRPFTLVKKPAKREKVRVGNRDMEVWSVEIAMLVDGKEYPESWLVRLRDDAVLTPVQIVARTRFGTFRANLKQ